MIRVKNFVMGREEEKPVDDDSKLQSILDWAHGKYGEPGKVLDIPDKLPAPSAAMLKRWAP